MINVKFTYKHGKAEDKPYYGSEKQYGHNYLEYADSRTQFRCEDVVAIFSPIL